MNNTKTINKAKNDNEREKFKNMDREISAAIVNYEIKRMEHDSAQALAEQLKLLTNEAHDEKVKKKLEIEQLNDKFKELLNHPDRKQLKEDLARKEQEIKGKLDKLEKEGGVLKQKAKKHRDQEIKSKYSNPNFSKDEKTKVDECRLKLSEIFTQKESLKNYLRLVRAEAYYEISKIGGNADIKFLESRHQTATREMTRLNIRFNALKEARNNQFQVCSKLAEEMKTANELLKKTLEMKRAHQQVEKMKLCDKVGMNAKDRSSAIIKQHKNRADIYYGGENSGDGYGHGHAVIKVNEVTYNRPPQV